MPFELTPFMDNRLFLIDGHALIFKMYYAFLRHPMINSKGVDTSILFGVTKYILELIEREKPSHIAVAFDPPGGTFRHDLYPAYKGTREATPQLVIDALAPLTELCEALKIKVLMVKGYEDTGQRLRPTHIRPYTPIQAGKGRLRQRNHRQEKRLRKIRDSRPKAGNRPAHCLRRHI